MSEFRTLRGKIEFSATATPSGFAKIDLILDDGLINTGYVIEKFLIFTDDPTQFGVVPNTNIYAQLSTSITSAAQFDAGDNRQIAWASVGPENVQNVTIIDEDHVINRDLFIRAFNSDFVSGTSINYLIAMRKRTLTNDEAIITILKEDGQTSSGP